MSTTLTADPAAGTNPPGSPPPGNPPPADWRVGLPEDLRANKVFEAIKGKDWAEAGPILAKNYVHAQSLIGADKVILPGKDATPEQMAEFYTKLGRPATPADYATTLPEGVAADKLDPKRLDAWKKNLHDLGMPKAAAEKLITQYLTEEHGAQTAAAAAKAAEQTRWEMEIKTEFGARFDERLNHAQWALKEFDKTGKLTELLDSTGLGSHPEVVRFFADVGKGMAGDSARGQGSGRSGPPNNPVDGQAALDAFNRDETKQKILFDERHTRHAEIVKERESLFKAAYPPKS